MTGSTSAATLEEAIAPTTAQQYYSSNEDAVAALKAGQIDAIVLDTPTAYVATVAPTSRTRSSSAAARRRHARPVGLCWRRTPAHGSRQRGRRRAARRTARSPRSRRSGWRADGRHPAAEVTRSGNVVP
jgi:hypothetical protein